MRALLLAITLFLVPVGALAALPLHKAPRAASAAAAAPKETVVPEADVRRVIEKYLIDRAAPLNAQVSVKSISYSGDLKLPAGVVTYEVMAPDRWEGYGMTSVALVVRVNDEVKKNLTVLVDVEALAEMVVATRTLERGEVVTADDLALARRDLAHVQGRFMKSIDEAVGLRVKSTLRANSPVRSDYLERVPVVKSGQMVTIVAENNVVRVTATGKAKGSGGVGDQIMVQNVSSNKDIAARVVDASTVRVDF